MKTNFLLHTVANHERWDTLAYLYYADQYAFGEIIRANPALAITDTLPVGAEVLIPIRVADEGNSTNTAINLELPPWM